MFIIFNILIWPISSSFDLVDFSDKFQDLSVTDFACVNDLFLYFPYFNSLAVLCGPRTPLTHLFFL